MQTIDEPAKKIPVVEEADICVLGGSCTGVFAAVRAARLGAKVVITEKTALAESLRCGWSISGIASTILNINSRSSPV